MPSTGPGAILQINWEGRIEGQLNMLTTHWRITADSSAGIDVVGLFNAINVDWRSATSFDQHIAAVASAHLIGIVRSHQLIYPVRYVKQVFPSGFPTGTGGSTSYPPNVAIAVTLRSDTAGRGERGTKHFGAIPTNFIANGLVASPAESPFTDVRIDLNTVWNYTVDGNVANIEPIIFHRRNPAVSPRVTNTALQPTSRVERRRTVGLGA